LARASHHICGKFDVQAHLYMILDFSHHCLFDACEALEDVLPYPIMAQGLTLTTVYPSDRLGLMQEASPHNFWELPPIGCTLVHIPLYTYAAGASMQLRRWLLIPALFIIEYVDFCSGGCTHGQCDHQRHGSIQAGSQFSTDK
jgi:hypothetical protein